MRIVRAVTVVRAGDWAPARVASHGFGRRRSRALAGGRLLLSENEDSVLAESRSLGGLLGLRAMARRASGLSFAALLSSALSLPATWIAARWLGPNEFGRAQYVLLFYSYGGLIRSGVFEGGMRAFMHLRGRDDTDEALRSQNVGLSFELVVSIVPGLLLAMSAVWARDPVQRLGFFVAPLAVTASSGAAFLAGMYMAREQFNMVTRVTVVRAVVYVVALLAGVRLFGASGAVLSPVLADVLCVFVYSARARGLKVRLSFERVRGLALTRAGFPLGAGAIVYWAYRLVGSTSVAVARSATVLGVYVFAVAPTALLLRALSSVQAVLTPPLWAEMARDDSTRWVNDAARIAVGGAVVAAVVTNLAQAGFAPVVNAYLPGFHGAIRLFDVLVLNVLLLSLTLVPTLVLDSASVNQQARVLGIFVGALVLNIAANITVLASGLGVQTVAWNDVWVQVVVVVAVHRAAVQYLPGKRWHEARSWLLATTAVTALVSAALRVGPQDASGLLWVGSLIAARGAAVIVVWALVAWMLRKWLRPVHEALQSLAH